MLSVWPRSFPVVHSSKHLFQFFFLASKLCLLILTTALSNNFSWFVRNILFWTYSSVLPIYLVNLAIFAITLCSVPQLPFSVFCLSFYTLWISFINSLLFPNSSSSSSSVVPLMGKLNTPAPEVLPIVSFRPEDTDTIA